MTRKELITYGVENQIKRGIIKPENKQLHINIYLHGRGLVKAMTKKQCEDWYNDILRIEKEG